MNAQTAAFHTHDHAGCVSRTAETVAEVCAEKGLRLTPMRRRVLEILLEEHKALGAYDVLARLAAEGAPAHPPVAYRALDFLVEHGFAHRIERLNAFVACLHPADGHRPVFLICQSCGLVAETLLPAQDDGLDDAANALGFRIERAIVEAEGRCPSCTEDA